MMIRFNLFLLLFVFFAGTGLSQELRCNVQVVSSQIQGTNKEVFRTLQDEIYEFMNNRIWTEDKFDNTERIECKILLNLTQHSGDEFQGTMRISSRRPVFNASYSSTLLQYKDNSLAFRYVENEPLEFDINSNKSNLTSLLAYYAYIIIGLDYDTFSPEGGTVFYEKAQQIVSNAQNSRYSGWKAFESRKNRYWLVENLLNDEYEKVREFYYKYHRTGLDKMYEDVAPAREQVAQSLELLKEVYREKPDPYMFVFNLVLEAKSSEMINIFSESPTPQANRVYEILAEIDPAQSEKYKQITQQ